MNDEPIGGSAYHRGVIGVRIGGYRVIEKLAEGGMGAVFIARHDLMQRDAVVKVLLPGLSANHEMVERFLNEARAVNQIHHAGIVEIFDLGFLPTGQAYIVMERLRGESLGDRLGRGVLSVPQAIALARQLASALGAAHEVGIIHRDLKPDNLFLCHDLSVKDPIVDGGERLTILDFGIAKVAQGAGSIKTVAGAVFGTPAYMSPEQCTSSGQVDARSDLYAIGCILYEALCGRPPFGQGGLELIAAQVRDPAPPPRTLAPTIPVELEAVILRLLEKDPGRRPQSCAELRALLEPMSTESRDRPSAVLTSGTAPPARPPAAALADSLVPAPARRRRPLRVAVGGLAVGGLATIGVVAVGGGGGRPGATPAADQPVAIVVADDEDATFRMFTVVPGEPAHSVASVDRLNLASAAVSAGGTAIAVIASDPASPGARALYRIVPEVGAEPVRVADVRAGQRDTVAAVSDDGAVIVLRGGDDVTIVRDGSSRPIDPSGLGQLVYRLALSADGSKLAFSTMLSACAQQRPVTCPVTLWGIDVAAGGQPFALASPAGSVAYDPAFVTTDGSELLYFTNAGDPSPACRAHVNDCRYAVHRVQFAGGDDRLVHDDAVLARAAADGTISFRRAAPPGEAPVFRHGPQALMIAEPGQPPRQLTTLREGGDRWSPDSRWILAGEVVATVPSISFVGRDGARRGPTIAGRNLRGLGWSARPLPAGPHTIGREPPPIEQAYTDDFQRDAIGRDYHKPADAYQIVDGTLHASHARNQPLWLVRALPPGDVQIDLDAWSTSASGDLKLQVWGAGRTEVGNDQTSGYVFVLGGWNNQISRIARLDELSPDSVQRTPSPIEPDRHYHWRIVRRGTTIDWYVDDLDRPFLTYQDPKILGGPGHEYLGLSNWDNDTWFDNLAIQRL